MLKSVHETSLITLATHHVDQCFRRLTNNQCCIIIWSTVVLQLVVATQHPISVISSGEFMRPPITFTSPTVGSEKGRKKQYTIIHNLPMGNAATERCVQCGPSLPRRASRPFHQPSRPARSSACDRNTGL